MSTTGHLPLPTMIRKAKPAPEVFTPGDPLAMEVSSTYLDIDPLLPRAHPGRVGDNTRSAANTTVTFLIENNGLDTVYLSWGGNHLNGSATHSTVSTLKVPANDMREYSMAAQAKPFHILSTGADCACLVDAFVRRF